MVTNLHERKFKTTKNSSVNQKTKLRGNLHVDFQREGQLKFFDVVGSFFLAHWIFYWHWKKILVSNFSQVTIFTQIVHVYDPRHLEWASLSESLSSRLFSGVIQPQHFGFFQTSGSFWSTGRDPFSTLGDYVWHQTKPYTFVFTFHLGDSGMRKCEVQQRDGWKSTINWLCTPSEKGNKHYLLSWVTSKE